ncbi:MAG TPA: hypothetical protein PLD03_01920 [Thiomonas arsenitoxydans]|nr:hypothetical protein [Thiomonas arsenitoxydans]
METVENLKRAICSLFEVHADERGVRRIITPLEYTGSNDNIVVRVRPIKDGFSIDENGDAAFYASLNGGDIDSDVVARWGEELQDPLKFTDEIIHATITEERFLAPYVFRVAEAAQQLYSVSTARADRRSSDFKERVGMMVLQIAKEVNLQLRSDVELPIAGGLKADHLLGETEPLIIVAATSAARLLEAEVIFMQYRAERKAGFILVVAEDQASVGKKQFERAQYYTSKSVIYEPSAFRQYIGSILRPNIQ